MGYYMDQFDTEVFIPKAKHCEALAAIKALMTQTDKMSGGSWGPGGCTQKWFSWVGTEEVLKAETLEDALIEWRWEPGFNDAGDIAHLRFTGEKLGDDEELMAALAPFMEEGSYIDMRGEDGALWRWEFRKGQVIDRQGTVIYE